MHTPAPGSGSSSGSGPAPVKQCQAIHKFSNVCSCSARPGPVRVLILWLSEDPALNSSCNTGKRSNWGIFYIINSGEQPPHSPSPLPLHFYSLYSHSHTFLLPNLFFTVFFLSPTSLHSLDLFSSFLFSRVRFLIHWLFSFFGKPWIWIIIGRQNPAGFCFKKMILTLNVATVKSCCVGVVSLSAMLLHLSDEYLLVKIQKRISSFSFLFCSVNLS